MIRPLFRAKVAAGVVVTLLCVGGAAFATGFEPVLPPPPDPHAFDPQLTVSPSDGLSDGQVVVVDGKRFGGNGAGVLRQCTRDRTLCSPQQTPFTTGRNGAFGPHGNPQVPTDPGSVPVSFTVRASFAAVGSGATVNCAPTNCILDGFADYVFEIRRACHHLSFGVVDATPCTQPSSASTTSTSTTTTTTTTTPPGECASNRAARAAFNAQIDRAAQQVSRTGSQGLLAALDRSRSIGNARFDNLLAGCPPA